MQIFFKDGSGNAGVLFAAIGIEHNGNGDSVKIGSATVQVHSEKLGIVTVRDANTGVNKSITYGAIHRTEKGDNPPEISVVLPPRISEDGSETVFDVVDLTPQGALIRSATRAEKVIAKEQEPQRLLKPEPDHDRRHPVYQR